MKVSLLVESFNEIIYDIEGNKTMNTEGMGSFMSPGEKEAGVLNSPLLKEMLIFALPIMAMNVLQLLFNAADMVVIGRFSGSQALAAVGATGSLISLIVNLFMGLSVGTSVIVAQDYGAGKVTDLSKTVHTSIATSVITGIIVMIIGFVYCQPLLNMMGTPDDIFHMSVLYMKIYFIGLPASMIYNFCAAILRAIGDSRRPMYYLTIAGIINVILNLLFVAVFNLDVAGVAWSTVISQYVSMVLILICLIRSDGGIRFIPKELRIDKEKLKQIIKIGLPAGLQGLLFSISNVLIQSAINSFGSTLVAANSAAGNVEGFVSTAMNGYYNAAITFAGQSMGAKDYDRIDNIAKTSAVLIFVTWIILGSSTVIFGRTLLNLYTSNPEVVELGMMRMKIMMAVYFTCGFMSVFPGLTRAMGYSMLPMLCTLIGACLMRIIWLATFFAWQPTIFMLYVCYPITWALAGIGQVASFFYARRQIRREDVLQT